MELKKGKKILIDGEKETWIKIRFMEFHNSQFNLFSPLFLSEEEIHLWLVSKDVPRMMYRELEKLLSKEEINRMKGFHFQEDRRRFAIAHGLLRRLVGGYLGLPPHLLNFQVGVNGKPKLVGGHGVQPLFFNLSHSHELIAIGFSRNRRIGIDVEHIRYIPESWEIVESFFHPREKAILQQLPLSKRLEVFFDLWTQKEAFVKATGEGLNCSFDSFFTSKDDGNEGGMLNVKGDRITPNNWKILRFKPALDYAGALAFEV